MTEHPDRLIAMGGIGLALATGWGLWFWQHRVNRRLSEALRAARQAQASWAALLGAWHWQSDTRHALTLLMPPPSAEAQTPLSEDTRLWDCFECIEDPPLKQRLASREGLPGAAVRRIQGNSTRETGTLRAHPLNDPSGDFLGYVGVFQADDPNQPVLSDTSAAQADQASFSYTVSHDLRAPIRVVEGFAKILKEDYGRVLDRVGNDHLERILGAASRMNRMIDSLLTLSQLSCTPLSNEAVNLSQLGASIVDDLRRQSPERHVDVRIEPEMVAHGDPTLLRIALENLLGNAWKYTGKTDHAVIWFERHGAAEGGFAIRDNGAGFDMRFSDRLFGVFQRLHGANDFQGTGVGLASVRRIVQRHGGDIWAMGEVNQGARFYFSLSGCNARPPTTQ